VLEAVARTRNRELFLLVVVLICLGVAWISSLIGLSLALGAFLAGLIVSESDYSYHAMGNITPFRDLFASLFFVTVGMLLDIKVVLEYPLLVLSLAAGIILLKALIVIPISMMIGYPLRSAVLTGIGLGNVGEFAFILSSAGLSAGLLSQQTFQIFLAVSALTMAASPFLIRLGPKVAQSSMKLPLQQRIGSPALTDPPKEPLSQHLIIVGFGVNGNNLARASQAVSIPYVILEMNPETVKHARNAGERIYFGDAAQAHVWHALNISQARIVVIAISDPDATRRSVALVRSLNSQVHIIARTRYLNEIDTLHRLGANEVIPEEFETAVEIFTLVLRHYLIPEAEIEQIVREVRSDNYEIFRTQRSDSALRRIESDLASVQLTTVRVLPEASVVGKSLAELRLRSDFGVNVLMIKRGDQSQVNPEANSRFEPGDTVVLVGEDRQLSEVSRLFQ
jgi:CPA2 family monovalent cation:H+ antiporter-2